MSRFYKQKIYKKYKDEIWGKIISKRFSYNRKAVLLNYRDSLLRNRLRIKTKFKYFRRGFLKHLSYTKFMFRSFRRRIRLFNFWKKLSFYGVSSRTRPSENRVRRKIRRRFRWIRRLFFKSSKAVKLLHLNIFFLKIVFKPSDVGSSIKHPTLYLKKFTAPIFFPVHSNKARIFYKTQAFLKKNNAQFMIKKRLNLRKQKIFFYSIHIAAPKKKVKKWSLFGLKNIYYKKISLFFGFKSASGFLRFYNKYSKSWGVDDFVALSLLESRLETFLLRLNLFPSTYFIKNFILHKNVFVDNRVISYSSHILKLNEIVSFNRKYHKRLYAYIKHALKSKRVFINCPSFIEADYKLLVAMLIRRPDLNSLTKPMSFELYTKFPSFHR